MASRVQPSICRRCHGFQLALSLDPKEVHTHRHLRERDGIREHDTLARGSTCLPVLISRNDRQMREAPGAEAAQLSGTRARGRATPNQTRASAHGGKCLLPWRELAHLELRTQVQQSGHEERHLYRAHSWEEDSSEGEPLRL